MTLKLRTYSICHSDKGHGSVETFNEQSIPDSIFSYSVTNYARKLLYSELTSTNICGPIAVATGSIDDASGGTLSVDTDNSFDKVSVRSQFNPSLAVGATYKITVKANYESFNQACKVYEINVEVVAACELNFDSSINKNKHY